MLKITSLFIITLVIVSFCFGQKTRESKFTLNQSYPSVYIKYIKTDERITFDSLKESFAWFRFHNNTKWTIVLKASGGFGNNDASLFYDILDNDNKITEKTYCHICSTNQLLSGNSILFSIPTKYLKNSDSFRIIYSYEWEETPFSSNPEKEPLHYVYFETPLSLKQ